MSVSGSRKSFAESVRRRRVFILGAGFSAGAGVPLTDDLLTSALGKFSLECPGLYSRVENYAKTCAGTTDAELDLSRLRFSDLCTYLEFVELREFGGGERWSENGSREKIALRFYLAKVLIERTPIAKDLPQMYLDFASQLHAEDIVLSLNWDGLLEVSLEAVGKTYTYNWSDEKSIKLCKLHGSVNWRLGAPTGFGQDVNRLKWESLRFTRGMMAREIYHTPDLLKFANWHQHSPLREVDPFLVLPGYGKAFDIRSIAPLWYKPEFAFATTHDIYIIGVALAHDDFFVRSFFLDNLPFIETYSGIGGRRIFIINPDVEATSNYGFVLCKGSAELFNANFAPEHVEFMARRFDNSSKEFP